MTKPVVKEIVDKNISLLQVVHYCQKFIPKASKLIREFVGLIMIYRTFYGKLFEIGDCF